ncbi:MAG TPA: hypothetical protein VF816_04455 [Rhodocyclaceae bacterium]
MTKLNAMVAVLLLAALFAASAHGQEYQLDTNVPYQHLYFNPKDLSHMDRFESVTVFFTDGKPDMKIADMFYQFAELIGQYNGATTVNVREFKTYAGVLQKLNCRQLHPDQIPAVVFTAKKQKYCQVFPSSDAKALSEVLAVIQRNLKCSSDVTVERLGLDARAAVMALADSLPGTKGLQRPAGELIDFLVAQLRVTCGREKPSPS